jgi:hypothetical protein
MPILNYPIRLNSIKMFLDRAFLVNDDYVKIIDKSYSEEEWEAFGEEEYERSWDLLLDYQDIVFRAVVWEINALIES